MSERLRIETIDEVFFQAPLRDAQGRIIPAPPRAQRKYIDLKNSWLLTHPRLPNEEPMVSLGPTTKYGKEGYSVRKEIIYRSPKETI